MAISTIISPKELQRQADLIFEGKTLEVMLCSVALSGYDQNSTVADWETTEISTTGYTRFTQEIGVGEYNQLSGRYEIPDINAVFTADTQSFLYDRLVLFITGETYIHSLIIENPNIIIAPGQTQTYQIKLSQDD